jgi:hypothetical protein
MKNLLLLALFGLLVSCSTKAVSPPGADASDVQGRTSDGVGAELEVLVPVCGDGTCSPGKENCEICAVDCGECACGDGQCTADEACDSCPADCGECPAGCGDGACGDNEDCVTCPGDCGNCCGNGDCGADEDCETCPADCGDCPLECGDGECLEAEDCQSCPADCGECECGDDLCNDGETCETCSEDCGECGCGDETCSEGEDCTSCAEDCGECECGDGTCNGEESCDTCPDDCTNCDPYCGDGVVDVDLGEECDDGNTAPDDGCDEECKIEPQGVDPGTIVITEIMKNPEAVDDVAGEWFELYNTGDTAVDLNGWLLSDDGIDQHKIFSYDGVVVAAKGYLVLGKEADKGVNGGLDVDYVYSNFNLSNKDDEVVLSVYGVEIDRVSYDNGQTFPATPGKSMSLTPAGYDGTLNDDGASWCDANTTYGEGDFGTPGEGNPDCDGQECGNESCEDGEDCVTCPEDCGACCGNGVCGDDEDCASCPQDCGNCCGNQACDNGETCTTCPGDCGDCPIECGDDSCDAGETCVTCPADCGACCGNNACDNGETCVTCPADCGACCGNNACDNGETCVTCPADCGACCGNNACDNGETCQSCSADCGACCGNNACDFGETCETCAQDCGECPAEVWCKLSGNSGATVECEVRIAAESNASSKATQFQFDINFNAAKVSFDGTKCMVNGLDMCGQFGIIGAGHSVDTQPQSAGVVRLTLTKSGTPKTITDAYLSGQSVAGNPYVLNLVFSLKTNVPSNQGVQVTLDGLKGADATASPLVATQQADGLIVTSVSGAPYCGDDECNNGETCSDCADDCGACPPAGWCQLSGSQGQQLACQVKLAAASNSSPKATQFQFDINFASAKVGFDGTKCLVNGLDMCGQFGIIGAGHSVDTQAQSAGVVRLTLTKSGTPKNITDAYVSGQSVSGNPYVLDMLFTLKGAVAANQAVAVTLTEAKGADATASPLAATQNADGVIVTSAQ